MLSKDEATRARRLVDEVADHTRGWAAGELPFLAQLMVARRRLGGGPWPASAPPLHRALDAMIEACSTDASPATILASALAGPADHTVALLAVADGVVPARAAASLADALEAHGLEPSSRRLAALLGAHAPDHALRFVERRASAAGERGASFIHALVDVWAASWDRGGALHPALGELWARTFARTPAADEAEAWHAARLRALARHDLARAFSVLDDDIAEVGATELGEGLTAVIARLARGDAAPAVRRVAETSRLVPRAMILDDLGWDGALASGARAELERLLAQLRTPPSAMDAAPRAQALTAMALVDLAARLGEAALAERVSSAAGLEPGWAFTASWVSARRRALRERRWDPGFWDTIEESARAAAALEHPAAYFEQPETPVLAPDVRGALWKVLALPLPELPWFEAWGGEVP